jgi:hypothetical protein
MGLVGGMGWIGRIDLAYAIDEFSLFSRPGMVVE